MKNKSWIKSFYGKMMGLMSDRGVADETQVAHAMRALAMREQAYPSQQKAPGRLDLRMTAMRGIEEGTLKPHRTRKVNNVAPVVHPDAVDKLLSDLPKSAKSSPEVLTMTIGRYFGYTDQDAMVRATRRAGRFIERNPNGRVPAHLRKASELASAVMLAVAAAFPKEADEATLSGAAALRSKFAAA